MSNPIFTELEAAIEDRLPSPLKPYAKAIISAIPPVLAAYSAMQAGDYSLVAVLQFVAAVLTTLAVYFVPALPVGKWQAASKTIVAGLGAVLAAGIAGFTGNTLQGWLGFASAALAAVLVEIVDNVPNATPIVSAGVGVVESAVESYERSRAAHPSVGSATVTFGTAGPIQYRLETDGGVTPSVAKPAVPLPTLDDVDPEG